MGTGQSQLRVAPLSPLRLHELAISSVPPIRIRLEGDRASVDGPATICAELLVAECTDTLTLDFELASPPGLQFGWARTEAQVSEGPLVPVESTNGRWTISIPVTQSGPVYFAFLSTLRSVLASFALQLQPDIPSSPISPVKPTVPERPPAIRARTSPQLGGHQPLPTITSPELSQEGLPEDGPLFRALVGDLERRLGQLRKAVKKLLKAYETELAARVALDEAEHKVDEVFEVVPGVRPLQDVYLSARRSWESRRRRLDIERLAALIDDVQKIAAILKSAEAKRKSFEADSKTWYDHLSKVRLLYSHS